MWRRVNAPFHPHWLVLVSCKSCSVSTVHCAHPIDKRRWHISLVPSLCFDRRPPISYRQAESTLEQWQLYIPSFSRHFDETRMIFPLTSLFCPSDSWLPHAPHIVASPWTRRLCMSYRSKCYLRQSDDQVGNIGPAWRVFDLFLCHLLIVESIGDVVSNAEIEEHWLLLH